jgi:hypothetical protein
MGTNKKSANRSMQLAIDRALLGKLANMPRLPNTPKGGQRGKSRKQRGLGGTGLKGPLAMAPVAQQRTIRTARPSVVTSRNGDCRIVHREYIQDILSPVQSTAFQIAAKLAINPGQASTYPWLSKIAQNFESYKFRKLKFDYETEQSTSQTGSAIMAIDYDASDPSPVSKQQMMAYRNSVRSAVWSPSQHVSSMQDLSKKNQYYVRPGPQPAGTDIKEYDVGNFFFAIQSSLLAGSSFGELYVEYDVDLITPVYEIVAGDAENDSSVGTTGQAGAHPFGTTQGPTQVESGQPLTTFTNVGAGTFTFNRAFTGLLILEYIGTGITAVAEVSGTSTIVQLGASADAGQLLATQAVSIVATQGQTFIVGALTATTVTSAIGRLASYPVAALA